MLTRLPPTRELLDALKRKPHGVSDTSDISHTPDRSNTSDRSDTAPPGESAGPAVAALRLRRLQRSLLGMFWTCSLAALLLTGAVLFARYQLRYAPAPWLPRLVYSLLAGSVIGLAGLLLTHLPALVRKLRDPLGQLAEQVDRRDDEESALLRVLARIPAPALRARARRVDTQLRIWEGMARTIALLIGLSPLALMLVTGLLELPRNGASLVPLLSLYGVTFVLGAALAIFLQRQVSQPLRRLIHVLGEAADISAQLGRPPLAPAVPVAARPPAVPSPAPIPPQAREAAGTPEAAGPPPADSAA